MNRPITIIIPWWSRTPQLEQMSQECLKSVLENTTYLYYDILIIENKSMHPSKFLREFQHPKVKIVFNDDNLGFIKANNQGMKLTAPNDVLLLNDDTQVPRGWLDQIMTALELYPDCGMMMPLQVHKGSKEFIDLSGDIPKLLEYMANTIDIHKHINTASAMQNGNWLPLCATVITRKAIDAVGYLDEEFKLGGFEDTDYSWRCLDAGFKLYVVSGSMIFHHYGQSFHYHDGYSEVWVETGKYLMKKHDAKQDSKGNVYRDKDKPPGWQPQ